MSGDSWACQADDPERLAQSSPGPTEDALREPAAGSATQSLPAVAFPVKVDQLAPEPERVEEGARIRSSYPRVNCPEKIVLCIDVASDMSEPTFRAKAGTRFAPLDIVKKALKLFVHNKSCIDSRHEYALVLLVDKALWVHDFTSDVGEIMTYVNKSSSVDSFTEFDMDSLFETLLEKAPLPLAAGQPGDSSTPPPYVLRTIFIYGRSYCKPKHSGAQARETVTKAPYCFFDAVYLHLPPSEENLSEAIFEEICKLDIDGLSYVYEVSRNPTKVFDCLGHLLAHPLQRPIQSLCNYRLEPPLTASPGSS